MELQQTQAADVQVIAALDLGALGATARASVEGGEQQLAVLSAQGGILEFNRALALMRIADALKTEVWGFEDWLIGTTDPVSGIPNYLRFQLNREQAPQYVAIAREFKHSDVINVLKDKTLYFSTLLELRSLPQQTRVEILDKALGGQRVTVQEIRNLKQGIKNEGATELPFTQNELRHTTPVAPRTLPHQKEDDEDFTEGKAAPIVVLPPSSQSPSKVFSLSDFVSKGNLHRGGFGLLRAALEGQTVQSHGLEDYGVFDDGELTQKGVLLCAAFSLVAEVVDVDFMHNLNDHGKARIEEARAKLLRMLGS